MLSLKEIMKRKMNWPRSAYELSLSAFKRWCSTENIWAVTMLGKGNYVFICSKNDYYYIVILLLLVVLEVVLSAVSPCYPVTLSKIFFNPHHASLDYLILLLLIWHKGTSRWIHVCSHSFSGAKLIFIPSRDWTPLYGLPRESDKIK